MTNPPSAGTQEETPLVIVDDDCCSLDELGFLGESDDTGSGGGEGALEQRHGVLMEEVPDEDIAWSQQHRNALAEARIVDEEWDPAAFSSPWPASISTPCPTAAELLDPSRPPLTFVHVDTTFPDPPSKVKWAGSTIPRKLSIIDAIMKLLHPPHKTGRGTVDPKLKPVLRAWLELMIGFLRLYKADGFHGWGRNADLIACAAGHGPWMSWKVHQWCINFCKNQDHLPVSNWGKFNSCILEDEDIRNEIHLHLQSLGPWISSQDIVNYTTKPEFQARLKLKKVVSQQTALRWLQRVGY